MVRAVIREDRLDEEVDKLAKILKKPKEEIKVVLEAVMIDRQNHKRQPSPPAPEGGISLRAAERKHGIKNETLSRWVKKGYIPILLRTKKELYIDESKLIDLLKLYRKDPGQGRWTIRKFKGNTESPV